MKKLSLNAICLPLNTVICKLYNKSVRCLYRLKGPTMRMHADVEESRQKLQATRKKIQQQSQSSSISSRLGDRVERVKLDADDDEVAATIASRPSVKDRLGTRQPFYRSKYHLALYKLRYQLMYVCCIISYIIITFVLN